MKLTLSSVYEVTRIQVCQPLFLALALFVTTPVALRAQLPNPAAYLTFDEGTGTVAKDSSGNNHNATLFGAAGWTTGLVGPFALSLPGFPIGFPPGSYAEIPGDVLDTTKSYTVAAWVKLNNISGYQTFVSEDGDFQSAFFLQLRGDSHQFSFTVPYDFFTLPQSGFTPVVGVWYHLAGVYDSVAQTASLYVNGALADRIFNVGPRTANGNTGIGRGWFNNGRVDFNNAAIDDVRFYVSALSAAQILQIAQIGNPSLTAPTVQPAALQIDATHPGPQVNPMFYGLMIEEINHSLDGGLYGELIQNRVFMDDPKTPVHWSLVQDNGGIGSIALDTTQPVSGTALATSLKVSVSQGQRVGAANDGYWGIPVKPFTTYRASFWAKAGVGFTGPLMLDIESSDGTKVYALAQVPQITTNWAKYTVLLTTSWVAPIETTRFVVSTGNPGTFWLTQVSLFPPTYHDRPNGNRIDLMRKMAGLKPSFLRMPGGNYLEGNTIPERFRWKQTIGPIEQRPGHQGTWGYRSDDGLGLLEFLEWCEDLHMQPLLAVWAGYALNGKHVNPGQDLAPYVQDALDEIQYVTGGTNTTWGAKRAADGHPAPFLLQYVEIGNEDFFDGSGSYDGRFAQFYDAIKAAYPNLKVIATDRIINPMRTPDLIDDHFYNTPRAMARTSNQYDTYSRTAPKVFVGEWASQEGRPTPDLNAALGDAAWLTGLERNSDVVLLEAYAPMLVNVNPGASQWPTNLIGYDALHSYGSPSYYVQEMFSRNHGDVVLPTTLTTTGNGSQVYASVTRDSGTGAIYLKVVNAAGEVQPVSVTIKGAGGLDSTGEALVLTSDSPQDTNTLSDPRKIVPETTTAHDLGQSFEYRFQPYSVTVLRLDAGHEHHEPPGDGDDERD
jgi:alpha-L-arabinofuranosidase